MICAWLNLIDHKLFEDGIAVIFDRFSFNKRLFIFNVLVVDKLLVTIFLLVSI